MFLKNVFIILEHEKYLSETQILIDDLGCNGVVGKVFSGSNKTNHEILAWLQTSESLWITDSSYWAQYIQEEKLPMVVFFHPDNEQQDFSMARYGMEHPGDVDIDFLEQCYCRFYKIPWYILGTNRCDIRETVEEDVESFYEIYHHPFIAEFMEELYPDIAEEKQNVRDYIEKVYAYYNYGIWTVILRDSGEIIGRAGFGCREGYTWPELGFIIGAPWQRKGLAYEVCQAILVYGWNILGFEKVQVMVETKNRKSISLCEKLGFQRKEEIEMKERKYVFMMIDKSGGKEV